MLPVLGIVYSLLSAASFGINETMTRRGMQGASASQGLYITVTFGVPMFLLAALLAGQFEAGLGISPLGLVYLAAAGLVHFLLGRYCNYRAIGALGANRSQPLRSTALLYSVGFAVLVLHEQITIGRAIGIALITGGALLMVDNATRSARKAAETAPTSTVASTAGMAVTKREEASSAPSQLVQGYIFGLLAGLLYGLSPILIKLGLEGTNVGLFGGFVSYLAAAVVLLSTLVRPGRWAYVRGMNRVHVQWFTGSALFVFLAQMFRYLALGVADVVLVAPLGQLNGMYTLAFSYFLNRKLESFAPQVLVGVALSVLGGIALVF